MRAKVEIRNSPNRGLGMFAIAPITCAATIMHDQFVLKQDRHEDFNEVFRTFTNLSPSIRKEILTFHGKLDEGEYQRRIRARTFNDEEMALLRQILHLKAVVDINSFSSSVENEELAGLCVVATRINHSCVPNASYYPNELFDCISIVATRRIEAGEEVTISYVGSKDPRDERRKKLLHGWHFTCHCPACEEHYDSHEQYLKRLRDTYDDNCVDPTSGRPMRLWDLFSAIVRNLFDWLALSFKVLNVKYSTQPLIRDALVTTGRDLRFILSLTVVHRYMVAYDIAIAQYRMSEVPSKLDTALEYLVKAIQIDDAYKGKDVTAAAERKSLYRQLVDEKSRAADRTT